MSETPAQPPRAALHALGCRLNASEIEVLRSRLRAAGYAIVPWEAEAELYVLNTCTVTSQADAKSRQAMRAARRRNPAARVAVTGCYAELAARDIAEHGLADLVVGTAEKLNLPAHLPSVQGSAEDAAPEAPRVVTPTPQRAPFAFEGFAGGAWLDETGGTRAHLKVQDGCDFMCSFCIIPHARGRARPRALDNLLAEAEALVAAGARELVLTGVNLGTYEEAGRTLVDVVDALDALPGLARVRISSIEPTTVAAGLLARMADPAHALVPLLHLPLQSGDAGVLTAMRRRYTPADYRAFAEDALAQVPGLCLGTDVMVGFPGEDAAAFSSTVELLEGLPFAYAHVFPYSERGNTPAVRMAERVPNAERQRRARELRELSERKRLAFHRSQTGQTRTVLFERGDPATGVARGYTDNYVRVEVPADDPAALRNTLHPVRLLEAGPTRVAGELA